MPDDTEPLGDAVTIGYVHNGQTVAYSWHSSLLRLLMWDSAHAQRIVRGGWSTIRCSTGGLVLARNAVVRDFLTNREAPWLWVIDTDMGFAPDTVDRLVESADPVSRPVVGALTFAQQETEPDGMGGFRPAVWPVLLDWTEQPQTRGFLPRIDYERDTLTRVAGTGSACILIHRSVLERVRDAYGERWYNTLPSPSRPDGELSEDLSFCLRLRELGIPIHVHTGIKTTHMKTCWLEEREYTVGRSLARGTHPHPYVKQELDGEPDPVLVSVLVPFRAPDGSHRARVRAYTKALWEQIPGVEVVYADDGGADGDPFNYAKAANRARAQASGKYLVFFGCDHLPDPDRVRWIRELLERMPWAGVYEWTHSFTEQATEAILAGADPATLRDEVTVTPAAQGVVAVRAEVWDDVGGMDERFTGWGFEDSAFRKALASLYPEGNGRGDGIVYTLWHPVASADKAPSNEALYREYVEAAEAGTMREYLDRVRANSCTSLTRR